MRDPLTAVQHTNGHGVSVGGTVLAVLALSKMASATFNVDLQGVWAHLARLDPDPATGGAGRLSWLFVCR